MGAKTGLLVYSDGDAISALRRAGRPDQGGTAALVAQIHPGYSVRQIDGGNLGEDTYPPDDVTFAAVLPDVTVLCDQRFMVDLPSELPRHLIDLAGGRRVVLHAMHSVVDWFAFGVWEGGELVRSLSLSPDGGIAENFGTPFDFELPFWAGDHPVPLVPGWSDDPYPLPFHPLDLGEAALRALFGFILEGRRSPADIDPDAVHLLGYRVVDPSGAEAARREAMAAVVASMSPPRTFRLGPDGTVVEVDRG